MEIIEEPHYAEQINQLRVNWRRLDEALMTLGPALSLIPYKFPRVPGTNLRRIKLVGFPGIPPLSVFFSFTDTTVNLIAAELIEFSEELF